MRTGKAISSISYNSVGFLKQKLDKLYENRKIEFYAFIVHQPEDDEGGKKQHIHLYVEPSGMIQTMEFGEHFVEHITDNNLPYRCLPFVKSTFGDWFLYSLHDAVYLASKHQSRKHHYNIDQIVTSDNDTLLYKVKCIDLLKYKPIEVMKQYIDNHLSFSDFFCSGMIPVQQISNYKLAWDMLKHNITYRGGRKGHE